MMRYSLILLAAIAFLSSCQKEISFENNGTVTPPESVKDTTRKFQLRAFYSDIPIDFIEYDNEVRSETDLWMYVNDYIKDDIDEMYIDSNAVIVYQNEKKKPGLDEEVLHRTYEVGSDAEGRYMIFLGPDYEPLKYRVLEMNADYFILYVSWKHGATVYSRFERVE